MPIHKVTKNGKTGYRFGNSGKTYFGKSGKSKAKRQMRAMFANGYKGSFHESKFMKIYNLFLEQIDKGHPYENMTIAVVPGSFKPPHKGHWEMIMNYVDKADRVIVLISNISTEAISSRSLSSSNLKDFDKIKNLWDSLPESDKIESVTTLLNETASSKEDISFSKLKENLEKIMNLNEMKDKKYLKFISKIESYLDKLSNSLFKSIRKTSNSLEITPEMSKEIFEIFAKAYGVEDKVEIKISEEASPISATYELIGNECNNCKILLGVSTKGGDESRWNNLKSSEETSSNEIVASPVDVNTMLSATDLRNNINNLKKEWFPDKLTDNDFEKIKNILMV